jgi:hypothetical protein
MSRSSPSRSTVSVTDSPGACDRIAGPRSSLSVIACPSTAVITSPVRSVPSAGLSGVIATTATPVPVAVTVYPRRSSATVFATICEFAISSRLSRASSARVRPPSTSCSSTISVSSSSHADTIRQRFGRDVDTCTVR